jgi:ABC-2 type transport system permease protein
MIAGALFYYQWHWWRNRLLMRVRRLRQPKYLFGAIIGGLYFYWYMIRNLARGGQGVRITPEHKDTAQTIAALVLLVMVLLSAWILPHARAALAFTEAEVAFLFPAPISRRTLIHFKLLKSQSVILLSAAFMTLIGRSWGGGNFVFRMLGWWVAFATLNLHMLGSSFVLTRLMDRGLSTWLRRILVLGAVGALAAGTVLWLYNTMPPPPRMAGESNDFSRFGDYAIQMLHAGPLPYLLFPFRLVVAPYFADNTGQFLAALGPALLVMGLHYWWVMRSNVSFEEASVELSRKMAERMAAVRSGNWQAAQKPAKSRRPPFQLRPTGQPAIALFWKNLISAGNMVTARVWLFLVWIAVVGGLLLQSATKQSGGMGGMLAFLALGLTGLSLFWGPQMLRNDLRQDLPATDVLKMYPLPGWQVVLGEILAPAAMLAGAQWLLLLVSLFLFPNQLGEHSFTLPVRISFALAAAIVLPCVDLMAMLIPNAAVLFFPAWFQLGRETPRGFKTMGQQLILMFGHFLILALSLAPAAAVFAVVFLSSSYLRVPEAGVLLGGVIAAALLLFEAGLGIKLLGGMFERFDLSGEVLQQG